MTGLVSLSLLIGMNLPAAAPSNLKVVADGQKPGSSRSDSDYEMM